MSTPYENEPSTLEAPLTVVLAELQPKPPHPGFWMALLWSVAFLIVVNVGTLFALVPIMVVQAVLSPNPQAFLNSIVLQKPDGGATLSPDGFKLMAPAVLLGQIMAILFAFLIVRVIVGRRWQQELAFRPPSLVHLALLLIGLPGFLILPEALAGWSKQVLPTIDYQRELNEMIRHWHWIYGVLGVGLGAGIGEELWCRGFLGRGLLARYGVGGGIILTSLLFGLMHLDPPHVVATACMGAALHFLYVTTRSLIAPMLVHALNNSAGFLQLLVEDKYPTVGKYLSNVDNFGLVDKTPLFLSCGILLAAVGLALYRSRVAIFAEEGSVLPAWQPPYAGVADPPPESGSILARLPLSLFDVGSVLVAVVLFAGTYWWIGERAQQVPPKPDPQAAAGYDSPCLNGTARCIV